MSDPIMLNTLYGVQSASLESLAQAAKDRPSQLVMDELRKRCQAETDRLASLYKLAYGQEAQQELNKDMTHAFQESQVG
ncbi:MAG TPA: hypothetical protein VIP51_11500 [Eoetvoesiella sp.]